MYLTVTPISAYTTFLISITCNVIKGKNSFQCINCQNVFTKSFKPISPNEKKPNLFSGRRQDEKSLAFVDIRYCNHLCGIPFNITAGNQETEAARASGRRRTRGRSNDRQVRSIAWLKKEIYLSFYNVIIYLFPISWTITQFKINIVNILKIVQLIVKH